MSMQVKKRSIGIIAAVLVILAVIASGAVRSATADISTPKGITEAYLKAMKMGEYEKAYGYASVEFDREAYEKSAELQRNLMKLTYAQMEYEVLEEEIEDRKALVRVVVRNANYLELMDDASYETLKADGDDAYTEKIFTEALQNAEKKEMAVAVNFRLEDGKWVFDGSNSLLQAAMLGYLELPEETEE